MATAAGEWTSDVTFFLNGKKVVLPSATVHPRMTLAEYLREHTRLTGTKLSCSQGGCGACNVMLTTFKAGAPQYSSVNACLRPIVSLDGCGVTTTEGLGSTEAGLHPVQERIATCNGSQCGYCTPGHVMAMYSLLRDKATRPESGPLSLKEVEERFDGNICRCTGYRPIMTAFHTFADEEAADSHEIAGLAPFHFEKYDVSKEPAPPAELVELAAAAKPLRIQGADGTVWYRPTTLAELKAIKDAHPDAKLVSGFTSQGVYGYDSTSKVIAEISKVPEVAAAVNGGDGALTLGASTTITEMIRALEAGAASSASFPAMVEHFKCVASWQVRNVGSIVGNLMMCRTQHFMSDLATVLTGAGARVKFSLFSGASAEVDLYSFLRSEGDAKVDNNDLLVTAVVIPFLGAGEVFRTYRQAIRPNNAHAYVNAAFRATVDGSGVISDASFIFGCIDNAPVRAMDAEKSAIGKKPGDPAAVTAVLDALAAIEIKPCKEYVTIRFPEGIDNFRRGLMQSFVFKFFVTLAKDTVSASVASAAVAYERAVSSGTQAFKTVLPDDHPGRIPITKVDAGQQAAGQVKYTDDIPSSNPFYAAFVQFDKAPALITGIDASDALQMPGVVDFVGAADIPAFNCTSPFAPGEELLFPVPYKAVDGASDEDVAAAKKNATLLFAGQPVGLIVAKSRREAEAASKCVKVDYVAEKGVYTIKEAVDAGQIDPNPLTCVKGDVEEVFGRDGIKIVEGNFSFGGQSHFTMEKHSTLCVPDEQGRMIAYAPTQGVDLSRQYLSAVLGKPGHKVEINARRLGGGFGSKFTKNLWVLAGCGVAANKLNAPVKMQNSIEVDMTMGGHSRHPFDVTYKAAVDPKTNKTKAFELKVYQDKGCATDFSPFCGNEIISHSESVYSFEAIKVENAMVTTNTPSNTAVRAPGIAQAFVIGEVMMEHLATELGIDFEEFRKINMMTESETTMAGLPLAPTSYTLPRIWAELSVSSEIDARKAAIAEFNKANKWVKRGIAQTPVRYAVAQGLNAGVTCLINVHGADPAGPFVEVHHGGVEMGQGLNTKVQQMVSLKLGVPMDNIFVHATSTAVNPNAGIIGGSVGSETTVAAAHKACNILLERLEPVKEMVVKERAAAKEEGKEASDGEITFGELAKKAVGGLMNGLKVNLQASANFSPKEGHAPGQVAGEFENSPLPQGTYLIFGAAVSEVEVDILTGDVRALRSDIMYDCGHSLNPLIDIGQAEGAFVFGQGFYLGEEIHMSPDGESITKGTWEYKPTLATNMPREFKVEFLKDSPYPAGVMRSKAVGEPPLLAAYSLMSATRKAIAASRVERGLSGVVFLDVPANCVRVRNAAEVSPQHLAESMQ